MIYSTTTPPMVCSQWRTQSVLSGFVVATVPVWMVSLWWSGSITLSELGDRQTLPVWLEPIFGTQVLAGDPQNVLACIFVGALYKLPLLVVAVAACFGWAVVFARNTGREKDPSWFMTGWLFTLLLPLSVSPLAAAVAVTFGTVVGCHIFGGTGRYLVSPALLGILFVHLSYPELIPDQTAFAEPSERQWAIAATLASAGGLTYLVWTGAASWRIPAGAALGLLLSALALEPVVEAGDPQQILWYQHLLVGNFILAVAFLATDPSAGPLTRGGRWLYGGLIGAITAAIRILDPNHPDGALFAVLLAALAVPLLDYLVVYRQRVRKEHHSWQ